MMIVWRLVDICQMATDSTLLYKIINSKCDRKWAATRTTIHIFAWASRPKMEQPLKMLIVTRVLRFDLKKKLPVSIFILKIHCQLNASFCLVLTYDRRNYTARLWLFVWFGTNYSKHSSNSCHMTKSKKNREERKIETDYEICVIASKSMV